MDREVVIPARFNGPPGSGHGGYSAGLAASVVDGPAEVSLRRPPPLGRAMTLRALDDGGAQLLDGDDVVAIARPVEPLGIELPGAVGLDAAAEAAERFAWRGRHPFPTCYACGPDRQPGDGLFQLLGAVEGRADTFASPFVTPAELADDEGNLTDLGLWASLDCPTGAAILARPIEAASVLASLTVRRLGTVRAGERHVVVAKFLAEDGRKRRTMAALYDAEGTALGLSSALWIALTPEQAAAIVG
jgi:hypothetical protein